GLFNSSLTSLDGLEALTAINGSLSIYYNFQLSGCCAIDALLSNAGVQGAKTIFFNKAGCNSVTDISITCNPGGNLVAPGNSTIAIGNDVALTDFKVMPNPAKNEVNIQIENLDAQTGELTIFNSLGQVVHTERFDESYHNSRIDLANGKFANGDYYIQVKTGKSIITKKLVVLK